MPIAAGNLFIGTFIVKDALRDAKAATKFGFPFFKHPKTLKDIINFNLALFIFRALMKTESL